MMAAMVRMSRPPITPPMTGALEVLLAPVCDNDAEVEAEVDDTIEADETVVDPVPTAADVAD